MPLISSGVVKGRRCPICGAPHTSCGPPYQGPPVAIPEATTVAEDYTLYIYTDAEGHTYQMTEADGEAAGYTKAPAAPADPEARARHQTEPEQPAEPDPEAQARPAATDAARRTPRGTELGGAREQR